jgi:hypothetical protein
MLSSPQGVKAKRYYKFVPEILAHVNTSPEQGCSNFGYQVVVVTKFCQVAPNIC